MTDTLNWSHQRNLFDPAHARGVTIIGCGAVGSHVVPLLAKCGVTRLTVYDADDVRSHNLPMSFFGVADLGRPKVHAVRDMVRMVSGIDIRVNERMYEGEELSGAVISCVDTMEARMCIWKQVRMNPNVDLLLDTRTDEHFVAVFAIQPCLDKDIALYDARMYPTSETPQRTCGRHGVAYMSSLAASLAVRALTGFWSGDTPRSHERTLLGKDGTYLFHNQQHQE